MKKTFIKPEAHTLAIQTENMICESFTQGEGNNAPTTAEAKIGSRVGGAISATTFAWN